MDLSVYARGRKRESEGESKCVDKCFSSGQNGWMLFQIDGN